MLPCVIAGPSAGVAGRWRCRLSFRIEATELQDVPPIPRAPTGGPGGVAAVGPGQAHDAEAGADALLGVGPGLQDQVDEGASAGADPFRLAADVGRRPSGVAALAIVLGPMADSMARLAGMCSGTVVRRRLPEVRT